ncbi:MAG TPA: hypothetical protein VN622_06540 [Clostridia bacterium]|nr:hypothetical protein [Clostridia bacterium]
MRTTARMLRNFTFALLLCATLGFSQVPQTEPDRTNAPVPTVTFELNWREADPRWYRISVDSTGRASYQSQPRQVPNEIPGDPYIVKFTASEGTRTQIFSFAKALNYFQGDFAFKTGNIANTGAKTLRYQEGDRTTQTTYNWSQNQQLMELTSLFQRISTTMEFGRRIRFTMRFDKIGLDADLKAMEEVSKRNGLAEIQVVEPTLRQIANDRSVMNITRQRALRILEQGNGLGQENGK